MSLEKEVFGELILPLRASWWNKPSGKDGKEGWLASGLLLDLCLQEPSKSRLEVVSVEYASTQGLMTLQGCWSVICLCFLLFCFLIQKCTCISDPSGASVSNIQWAADS
ncbi:hypothetical protein ILYODFUR_003055 [Ilyodon furcidens]|uniref:Uncharacterized protein n=1 Tax=Ilyodon furcidens TaxID=33524 RepID=A0ABV0SI20_9TELE